MKYMGTFFAGLLVGALLLFLVGKQFSPINPMKTSFKVTGPGGKGTIELNVEGESIDYEKILIAMFSSDFLRPAAAGWLAEKQDLYGLDREELVTAIARKLCAPIPEEPLTEKLAKGRLCAEKIVVARLRELAHKRLPPFHHVGREGKAGLSSDSIHRPSTGTANVCLHGEYYGKRLQVTNPINGKLVEVSGTGHYVCTPAKRFPDIQLGRVEMIELFGQRPLTALENVVIVPLD